MRKLVYPIWKLHYLLVALPLLASVNVVAQQPPPNKPAEEVYKNIQVLKGMPAPQLMPTMKEFAGALGVKCGFCHVMGAFDKDDKKEKQTARMMLRMAHQINKDNFGGHMRVTCWTCHRGASEPPSAEHETEKHETEKYKRNE